MDKRDRARLFQKRLSSAMGAMGVTGAMGAMGAMSDHAMSRSELARQVHVDRSTIGQLLNENLARLPNGQLLADIASALHVSSDWLLGLTHRPERPSDIVAAALALSPAERSSADEQLLGWHHEAAGFKIRHVPATLPDLLKTEKLIAWEYAPLSEQELEQGLKATRRHYDWLNSGQSDYEILLPIHELHACAEGTGYYAGLDKKARHEQLQFIADNCRNMFPRLQLFLFDAHKVFSAPVTIFGPNLAIIYVGQCYLAFRESQRVRSLSNHCDWLIREADIDPRQVPDYIEKLIN